MPPKMMRSMRGTNAILDTVIDVAKKHKLLSRGASMIPFVGKPLGSVLSMLGLGKKGKGHTRRMMHGGSLLPSQVGVAFELMPRTAGGTIGLGKMSGHGKIRRMM